ncbi:MAG: DUF1579 family protein [Myxococcales bacterium]|nr:DUF1579 family protein [Myxococcales bacterium]
MEMPKVSPEQARLNALFAGVWRGEETLFPSDWDPQGGTAFGTWVVHASLDGFSVLLDYTEEKAGTIVYRGHGVHGWDAQCGAFLVYWFDNLGMMPHEPAKATLDGNRYTYQTDDGPRGWTRMTYDFTADTLAFRIERSKDQGATWSPMHDGRYRRAT